MCNFLDLFDSLEIREILATNSDDDLQALEEAIGFRLPRDFRNYCRIFGGGFFGVTGVIIDFISRPEIPNIILNEKSQRETISYAIESLKIAQRPVDSNLRRLVSHSYNFGYSYTNAWFLWDLESYSREDESYDIYIVKNITSDQIRFHKLGRNFCEFIRDCVMARNPDQNFLELLRLYKNEDGHITLEDPTFFDQGNYFSGSGLEE
jgi:hypothetical protein